MGNYYRKDREIWMIAGDCAGKIGEFNNENLAQKFLEAIKIYQVLADTLLKKVDA